MAPIPTTDPPPAFHPVTPAEARAIARLLEDSPTLLEVATPLRQGCVELLATYDAIRFAHGEAPGLLSAVDAEIEAIRALVARAT